MKTNVQQAVHNVILMLSVPTLWGLTRVCVNRALLVTARLALVSSKENRVRACLPQFPAHIRDNI